MTFEHFRQIISDTSHVPIELIKEDSSFRDHLGIDSLQMVNLLIEISEKVGTGLEKLIGLDDLSTVGKLYDSLTKGIEYE
ncbi:acyl carrier protein [Bacillus sp. Marseille-P3661]|uniref:acyl carrier protein n=1 Tax=Bacillus sp. Marseille-P3661 TaxID=1936234 RepID=UPI000C82F371|nr:phosphopantetheine-binding protein [Bacillus sp. Marseille-P3661]